MLLQFLLRPLPAGGQQGSTLDITVAGGDLDGANVLTFSHSGITSKPKLDGTGKPVANQYTVTIGKDVPVGFHDVRTSGGKYGVTNVRSFAVGVVGLDGLPGLSGCP